jgi:serine/threonine protein kinase
VSVNTNPSKPRFSLKSVGSISTSASSSSSASVGVTSLDLLGNMMTAYRDRDPYEYYAVLDTLGQGSIGSVEKVVRRRRHHIVSNNNSRQVVSKSFFIGGIFSDCCVDDQPSLLQSILSKITGSHRSDAFQSVPSRPSPSIVATDSNRSNISENSAFSAPTSPLTCSSVASSLHPWNSIRSDNSNFIKRSTNSNPHALRRYALKSIRLDRTKHSNLSTADEKELRNEISILRSLDHPHITHIIETYEYRRAIYLLLDLCEGGDLYVMDPYEEKEARGIMKQLCMAVAYMHRRGVVHRDLKYENVMFVERTTRDRLSIKVRRKKMKVYIFWSI